MAVRLVKTAVLVSGTQWRSDRHRRRAAATRSRSSAGWRSCRPSSRRTAAARRQRARARSRARVAATTHRYVATLATLGYLQQDAATTQVPARPARARPRLLRDQLDGAARGLGAAPARALRRDRPDRQHGDPRRRSTSSTSSAAAARGAGSATSTSTSTSARGCPPTAPRSGKVLLALLPPERAGGGCSPGSSSPARGPNTITARAALAAELQRVRGAGFAVNNEELAYGLRSIAAPLLDHEGRAPGRDQPRGPQLDGLDRGPDRPPERDGLPDGGGGLGAPRPPARLVDVHGATGPSAASSSAPAASRSHSPPGGPIRDTPVGSPLRPPTPEGSETTGKPVQFQ